MSDQELPNTFWSRSISLSAVSNKPTPRPIWACPRPRPRSGPLPVRKGRRSASPSINFYNNFSHIGLLKIRQKPSVQTLFGEGKLHKLDYTTSRHSTPHLPGAPLGGGRAGGPRSMTTNEPFDKLVVGVFAAALVP